MPLLLTKAGITNQADEWIVVDRKAAETVAKSTDQQTLKELGFHPLGQWKKKGVLSAAFGYAIP